MSQQLISFIAGLELRGCDPQEQDGAWKARCPACRSSNRTLLCEKNGNGKNITCTTGCTPEQIIDAYMKLGDGQLPEVKRLKTFSDVELGEMDLKRAEAIVPGFFYVGVNLVTGSSKAGKTRLVHYIVDAIEAGHPVFGKFPVKQCEVLCLFGEDPKWRIDQRSKAIREEEPRRKGLRYVEMGKFPKLGEGLEEMLEAHIDEHPKCKVIVVDTWTKIAPRRKGGKLTTLYESDVAAWSRLHRFAHKHDMCIIVLHHSRKTDKFDTDWIETISGTMGVTASVDMLIYLKRPRGESTASLFVAGREVETEREYAIQGDKDTCRWELRGDAEDIRLSATRQEIITHLRDEPGCQAFQIAKAIGKNESTLRTILSSMKDAGQVRKQGRSYYPTKYIDTIDRDRQIDTDRHMDTTVATTSMTSTGGTRKNEEIPF
ncbi:AAA family ATPase [Candidatus Moduliflexota bacterium]